MSAQPNPDGAPGGHAEEDEFELVDAVPVENGGPPLARSGPAAGLERRHGVAAPAVQAAAAAAGGFVAGAALFGLVQRRQRRAALTRSQRARRRPRRGESGGPVGDLVQIVASRSLLVDVHLLAGPGGGER